MKSRVPIAPKKSVKSVILGKIWSEKGRITAMTEKTEKHQKTRKFSKKNEKIYKNSEKRREKEKTGKLCLF